MQNEVCEQQEVRAKVPTIDVKIMKIDAEHYMVSFHYRDKKIFHTLVDVLEAIKEEVRNA